MSLVEFAQEELKRAGMFDEDSDYGGLIGPAVLEMVKQFAAEGHSGCSASLCLHLFKRLAAYKPIHPIPNPMESNEYIDHTGISGGQPTFQSTRYSSVFSEDGGKRWYDINLRVPKWKQWLGVKRAYITFPYLPK